MTQTNSTSACVRVLVGDSNRMGSQLLAEALARDSRFTVVSICSVAQEILTSASTSRPDVALISTQLDDDPLKGFEIARYLKVQQPQTKIVLMLDSSKKDLVIGAFAAGARGVFCRAETVDVLRKCIYSVHIGQTWASSNEMQLVLDAFSEMAPSRLVDAKGTALLSKREQDVVRCVTEGLTNREIAARLRLSEHTVKNYIFRIFDKLGVSTRVEMVLYAFSQRLGSQSFVGDESGLDDDSLTSSELEKRRRLADKGGATVLLQLAEMYRIGSGVPKDHVEAYMWFKVGLQVASKLHAKARKALLNIAQDLTPQQIEEADGRASEWLQTCGGLAKDPLTPLPPSVRSQPPGSATGPKLEVSLPRKMRAYGLRPASSEEAPVIGDGTLPS